MRKWRATGVPGVPGVLNRGGSRMRSQLHYTAMALGVGVLLGTRVSSVNAQSSQPVAPAAVATPCEGDANRRRLDFWIGEWNVENKAGQPAGQSSVQSVSAGCALLENWTARNGSTG